MSDEEVKAQPDNDPKEEQIEIGPEPEPETEEARPTVEELKSRGWSEEEIQEAEKRGLTSKGEKEEETSREDKKPEQPEQRQEKEDKGSDQKTDQKKGQRPPSFDLTPEQESKFKEMFGEGTEPWAMYVGMKRNRRAAQEAKEERDKLLLEMKHRDSQIEDLRQQMNSLLKGKPKDEEEEFEEEKPLTASQLKKLREEEEQEKQKSQREQQDRQAEIARAIQRQDDAMRDRFPDFDDTMKLAAEVIQNRQELFDDPIVLDEVEDMMAQIQMMAANATKFSPEKRNASYVAYKLGKLHPKHGKPNSGEKRADDVNGKNDPEQANGGLTPEQMERINKNATRRSSSASVSGGSSKRVVNPEDVTQDDLLHMSRHEPDKFRDFRAKHPKRYKEIVYG